jgi:hypothetical protein
MGPVSCDENERLGNVYHTTPPTAASAVNPISRPRTENPFRRFLANLVGRDEQRDMCQAFSEILRDDD